MSDLSRLWWREICLTWSESIQRHSFLMKIIVRSSIFWDFTQCRLVVSYRSFGTTYRYHLRGSSSPSKLPQNAGIWQRIYTQRQARELISGPCLGAKDRFLPFNRTQSRTVTGLLTGRNTLSRDLHLIGLSDSPLCRRCRAEDETSTHILWECEAVASLRHVYLGSVFLEPENFQRISLGANRKFSKATGLQ